MLNFIERISGTHFIPFMYLGAKHMVTGYDHLLFLAGVIFFLYRIKDVALYVTLFAIGHSTTLLFGILAGIHADAYIVDAIIGLSVVYKAFENIMWFSAVRSRDRYQGCGIVVWTRPWLWFIHKAAGSLPLARWTDRQYAFI